MRHNGTEVFIIIAAIAALIVLAALSIDHFAKKRLKK